LEFLSVPAESRDFWSSCFIMAFIAAQLLNSLFSPNLSRMSASQQEEYLSRLRQQIQAQTIQEIMNKMSEKCFKVVTFYVS
jgi:hypothetical protein